ncbi:MAG: hypothetical protein ACRCSB_00475 [Bacteroidales bacterium]
MNYLQNLVLYIFFFIGSISLQAQEVIINLSLEQDSVIIGDQVDLTVNISYSKNLQLNFPSFGDTLIPGIEVIARTKIDTLWKKKEDELINVSCTYTLTSFDGGIIYTLPKIQMLLQNGTQVDTFSSNELQLKVAYPPMDSSFIPHDIKPPLREPITFVEIIPYLLIGLLFAALIVFLIYYWQQRKKNLPLFFNSKVKEPAHIIALRELEKIKKEELWQRGKVKEFHTRLSEITRNYLEQRYAIQAMEQTSEEIIRSLKTDNYCSIQNIEKLSDIFVISDLTKFANYTPQPSENEECLIRTCQFIEETLQEEIDVNKESNANKQ